MAADDFNPVPVSTAGREEAGPTISTSRILEGERRIAGDIQLGFGGIEQTSWWVSFYETNRMQRGAGTVQVGLQSRESFSP